MRIAREQLISDVLNFQWTHLDSALDGRGSIFFRRTEIHSVKIQNCRYAASNRSARSGAQPSAPPRGRRAANGMATKELAKERAQDTAIILAHRRLHANAAEWNRSGGASRALTAAKLSTSWRDSSLQRPPIFKSNHHEVTPVNTEEFRILPFLVLPCPRKDGTVHPGRSWLRSPVRSKGAPKGEVHRQLGTEIQRETCREHLYGPIIVRGHSKVHVAEFCVVSNGGPGFTAHSRQSALWSKSPSLESARPTARGSVATSVVQRNPTFATNLSDLQGQSDSLQDDGSEEPRLNSKLWLRRASTQHV